jgi:hypothetical protein
MRLYRNLPIVFYSGKMRTRKLLLFLSILACAQAEQETRFVVLPGAVASSVVANQGTWTPTQNDIDGAEEQILQITTLRPVGWGFEIHIEDPERYFRQYVPVRRAGQQLLYLNAFCDEQPPNYWRKRLVIVADGATCYWQAFYDPKRKSYSNLTINGRG